MRRGRRNDYTNAFLAGDSADGFLAGDGGTVLKALREGWNYNPGGIVAPATFGRRKVHGPGRILSWIDGPLPKRNRVSVFKTSTIALRIAAAGLGVVLNGALEGRFKFGTRLVGIGRHLPRPVGNLVIALYRLANAAASERWGFLRSSPVTRVKMITHRRRVCGGWR
jgi:hypothetical protein